MDTAYWSNKCCGWGCCGTLVWLTEWYCGIMLYGVECSWRTFYGNCWHIAIRLLIWLNRRTCLFKSRHTAFIFRVRIRFSFLLICPFYHFRKINSVILCDSRDFTIIRRLNTHKMEHQHIWFTIFQWVYFSLTAFNYFHEWSIVSFFVFGELVLLSYEGHYL